MNCRDFCEILMEEIRYQSDYRIEVTHRTLKKNNGVIIEALEVSDNDDHLAPSIYVRPYYERFRKGVPLGDVAAGFIRDYFELEESPRPPRGFFGSFEKVAENIYCKLVSFEKNLPMLKEVPYERWLDLAVVYYYQINDEILPDAAIMIKKEHLQMWGVDEEHIRRTAWKNTLRKKKTVFQTLGRTIKEMEQYLLSQGMPELPEINHEERLYILSNRKKLYGAISICYPGEAEKIAELLDNDYFLIPSSIHECLILPNERDYSLDKLSELVREVNRTQLAPQEVLSEHAYFYDRKKKKFFLEIPE
ncbi:MAG TPA: hypothetical protein DCM49_06755 [Lachnospiraceae bacterium]|nr:hypothetical protein [Lachnospiraceae bacterium]